MTTGMAVGAAAITLLLTGCSETLAAEDQVFVTNDAEGTAERIRKERGDDKVQLYSFDDHFDPDMTLAPKRHGIQVIVLQCELTEDGVFRFGTLDTSIIDELVDSWSDFDDQDFVDRVEHLIPDCKSVLDNE
ncbi:hypothetical protein [Leucobacter sp. OH1287]|uniref:hypothetical protein n=1 Tax=Leucobacter sp. OH1287 TaxID=2491049 RepID=UPI000F5F1812|nr:hypothetical protein [Leucobacter sp. OH1287]RRD59479.1 hypothetical protein EII30_08635 [Leucobacter sp. OH1287]